MVLVDSHSKWTEVFEMLTTTTQKTIDKHRYFFAPHGLPEEIVSDNLPQFKSYVFRDFCRLDRIKQTLVPAYHPVSNGAAERSVRILKQALFKGVLHVKRGGAHLTLLYKLAKLPEYPAQCYRKHFHDVG